MMRRCAACGAYHVVDRKLLGKDVRFAHQPNGPIYRVQAIGRDGMVTLAGLCGEFAPHLFVITEEKRS